MGMFDTVVVAEKLPYTQEMIDLGLDKIFTDFQTKDLENSLSLYFIQNGKLYIEKYKETKWIEGDKNASFFLDRIGRMERLEPYQEDTNFHGKIIFYDYEIDVADKWDCWVEFEASFTNGLLNEIKLVKFDKKDNSERKAREEEFQQQEKKIMNAWYNKYFKFYRIKNYFRFVLWYRPMMKLSEFFSNLSRLSF